jgi:hypothetical protein
VDGWRAISRAAAPTASIRCVATSYVGSEDWIVPHVRADVEALDATLDIIEGQGHLGSFFASAEPVLAAVGARLRLDIRRS